MSIAKRHLLLWALVGWASMAHAQSQAALDKMVARYGMANVQDMFLNGHYKYEGMLLFYSASFLVADSGGYRAASEAEIAAVDLDQYNGYRTETESVVIQEDDIGRELLLLSRQAFEQLLLAQLNDTDRTAYLAYMMSGKGQKQKVQY